jgi:glycosyltransferase involved in cell wall biosynthesis
MTSLVWNSVWGGRIGLSSTSEALAVELVAQGVDLMHRPTPHPFTARPALEVLRAVAARPVDPTVPQISYIPPDQMHLGHKGPKIAFTMLEVDGIPRNFVKILNRVDQVLVPSTFNSETFSASGVRVPIAVVPLGLDPRVFSPDGPRHRLAGPFVFVSVFEWGERKAPELLLSAFNETFRSDEPVVLVVKTMNFDGDLDIGDRIQALRLDPRGGRIFLSLNRPMPAQQLAALYRSADCFVMPTRGEGWGMPILEAMACGLPAIATHWSAPVDFVTEENGYPLPIEGLVSAVAKCPYYKGFRWAQPSYDHLRRLLRHVAEHPDEARAKGRRASEQARQRWTWAATAARIRAGLEDGRWNSEPADIAAPSGA